MSLSLSKTCSGTIAFTSQIIYVTTNLTLFLTIDDTYIYVDEFINDWLSDNLGTALEAVTLFHHLDVDNSGYISENPDMPYIIHFFDRDRKYLFIPEVACK